MKRWLQIILATGGRTIRWLIAPARAVRFALVLVLSTCVAWLTIPPSPDVVLRIPRATRVEFTSDGTRLLIASVEKGITLDADRQRFTLWDVKSKTTASSFITARCQWAWSPNGRYMAVIDAYSLALLDTETGTLLKTVNVYENPPHHWTSWGTLPDMMAKTVEELSQIKLRVFPRTVEFATDNLLVVTCQPDESWRIDLQQRGIPGVCQRRYRTPDLEGGEAEIWTWLTANQRETRSRTLIAREWQKDQMQAGWRLVDLQTGRTKVWIVDPSRNLRVAGLSADETIFATGLSTGSTSGELMRYRRLPDDPGVHLYDADTGGLLRSFPDEFNPKFSHEGAYLLTQAVFDNDDVTPLIVRLRNSNNGALLSELDLSRAARTTGQTIEDRTETDEAISKGLKPAAVPPPRLASCKVLTTRNVDLPFVAIRHNTGTQISWLNRLRRLSAESDLIDLKQGSLVTRLPECHALSPNLDWAVELRENDIALWKLHGWRWPLSLRQVGLASLLVLAALFAELIFQLWFAWLRTIGAIETTSGKIT